MKKLILLLALAFVMCECNPETYFDRDYICTKPIDLNLQRREGYIKGYDQAMQDFLEKACEWLEVHLPFGKMSHESVYDCIQEFKNYMENEEM